MPFNGSGIFNRLYSWVQDKNNNIPITSSKVDAEDSGFASGLSLCVTRDGQGQMAANFNPSITASYDLGTLTGPFQWRGIYAQYLQATSAGHSAWGPNANALVDLTPDTGQVTLTFTGFSSGGGATLCTWARVGKLAFLYIPTITGTSNATTFTASGLPAEITPLTISPSVTVANVTNNSLVTPSGGIEINTNNTLSMLLNGVANGWTASGTKGLGACVVSWLII